MLMCVSSFCRSGSPVLVQVQLEREEEVTGPVIAPLFPQVNTVCFCISKSLQNISVSLIGDGFLLNAFLGYRNVRRAGGWSLETPSPTASSLSRG